MIKTNNVPNIIIGILYYFITIYGYGNPIGADVILWIGYVRALLVSIRWLTRVQYFLYEFEKVVFKMYSTAFVSVNGF